MLYFSLSLYRKGNICCVDVWNPHHPLMIKGKGQKVARGVKILMWKGQTFCTPPQICTYSSFYSCKLSFLPINWSLSFSPVKHVLGSCYIHENKQKREEKWGETLWLNLVVEVFVQHKKKKVMFTKGVRMPC